MRRVRGKGLVPFPRRKEGLAKKERDTGQWSELIAQVLRMVEVGLKRLRKEELTSHLSSRAPEL